MPWRRGGSRSDSEGVLAGPSVPSGIRFGEETPGHAEPGEDTTAGL